MASRHTLDHLLDALAARVPRDNGPARRAFDQQRLEQELEEVVQLAERMDAAHFRDRIDCILASKKH